MLKKYRTKRGISQSILAVELGVNINKSSFFINQDIINFNKDKLYCAVNSYGDGGTNVCIILESDQKGR